MCVSRNPRVDVTRKAIAVHVLDGVAGHKGKNPTTSTFSNTSDNIHILEDTDTSSKNDNREYFGKFDVLVNRVIYYSSAPLIANTSFSKLQQLHKLTVHPEIIISHHGLLP